MIHKYVLITLFLSLVIACQNQSSSEKAPTKNETNLVYKWPNQGGKQIGTLVGTGTNQAISSKGIEGFLSFGPYIPLSKGKYHLLIKGNVKHNNGYWVDIVHEEGNKTIDKYSIDKLINENYILDQEFEITENCKDLEVRCFVKEGTIMNITGYIIEKK